MSDSTVTKKIKLEVSSPSAKLTGIEQADAWLRKLNVTLERTTVLTHNLGGNSFSHLGSQAEAASARAVNSINNIGRAARAAMADISRINVIGGSGSRGGGAGGGRIGSMEHAIHGITPAGFVKNSITAVGWLAAYQGVSKVTEAMEYSVHRMMALEKQTAVLKQTFRGVGGTAGQLADDVLKLAAAEGRGTEEAMKAATHWTRLGLSRTQVAEATRVSLIAANVAEMSADEATEKLSSVMATYNLNASELSNTLGMLSRTSQTYRATVGELLNGLSRVSNVAKESGMSLAQLQGIMGAMIQRTGVSGERVANAMQIFLNRLSNPGAQAYMERNYKTQLTGSYQDFYKIYDIYQKASADERRSLATILGTPRQSNIFTGMMGILPEMDKAATSSLTHMDAALEENAKVTNTASAAVDRLKSSWDRLVTSPTGTDIISGTLNTWAGQIQSLTNLFGGLSSMGGPKKQTYFNPENANAWGLVSGYVPNLTRPGRWASHALGWKSAEKFFGNIETAAAYNLGFSEFPDRDLEKSLRQQKRWVSSGSGSLPKL